MIEFRRVSKSYNKGKVKAVDGISFAIRRGETLGLVGESGSGKTTAGLCLLQLHRPTAGAVIYQGRDLCRLRGETLRRVRQNLGGVSHKAIAGIELALWCDLRVVEETAIFGVFCRRWGVPLIDGGTVRLPRLVGMGRALDMILTGRSVHADEALAIGLAAGACAAIGLLILSLVRPPTDAGKITSSGSSGRS